VAAANQPGCRGKPRRLSALRVVVPSCRRAARSAGV